MYTARFEFLPGFETDFLPEGQLITQMDFDDIQEIVEYVQEFAGYLRDALVFCHETAQVVDLDDFTLKS